MNEENPLHLRLAGRAKFLFDTGVDLKSARLMQEAADALSAQAEAHKTPDNEVPA